MIPKGIIPAQSQTLQAQKLQEFISTQSEEDILACGVIRVIRINGRWRLLNARL
jgi:hypothetical protein